MESRLVARSAGVKIKGPRFSGASILGQLHETKITSKRTSHITNCGAVARVAHACLMNIPLTSGSAPTDRRRCTLGHYRVALAMHAARDASKASVTHHTRGSAAI